MAKHGLLIFFSESHGLMDYDLQIFLLVSHFSLLFLVSKLGLLAFITLLWFRVDFFGHYNNRHG